MTVVITIIKNLLLLLGLLAVIGYYEIKLSKMEAFIQQVTEVCEVRL